MTMKNKGTIQKNADYNIKITDMTHDGLGVGKVSGFTVFVEGAITDEIVFARIVKLNKTYAFAKLLKIISSKNRVEPFCPVYKSCGGCSLQHVNYYLQMTFKKGLVEQSLKRIGGLDEVIVHPTIPADQKTCYRNKAQYCVGSPNGETHIGFYAKRSHDIVDSSECAIQHELSDKVRNVVKEFMAEHSISAYDEVSGEGLLRNVMTRIGFKTGEIMVVLVINGMAMPHSDELVSKLKEEIPGLASVFLNVNAEKGNVILSGKYINIYGKATIEEIVGQYKFRISPSSFFQVNPMQTEILYNKVCEYAGLTGKETVFDLYCGTGTIGIFMSGQAKKVYGVDVASSAISDARENAKDNGVPNAEFICDDVEKAVADLYAKGVRADVVVLDPPRKGCTEEFLKVVKDMKPAKVVYVSCDPGTLARDLKILRTYGFEAQEAQPVDMFPWTSHVECVCLLTSNTKGFEQ